MGSYTFSAPARGPYGCRMTRRQAAVGSFVFALGEPVLMAGLVPYWITDGWHRSGASLAPPGAGAVRQLSTHQ